MAARRLVVASPLAAVARVRARLQARRSRGHRARAVRDAERALRASELRYREMVEVAPHGIALLDLDGIVIDVNAATERLLGYTRAEILGKECWPFTHPEDHAAEQPLLDDVLAGRRDGYALEKRYLRRGGEPVWARLELRLIRDDDAGRPARLLALIEDISDRRRLDDEQKRLTAQLREQRDRLQLALTAAAAGTWRWDFATDLVEWSADLDATGGSTERGIELRAEEIIRAILPEDRERVIAAVRHARATGDRYHAEYRTNWPDGTVHWLESHGLVLRGEDGEPAAMTGVAIDITDRKRAEERSRLQQERYETLFAHAPLGIALADVRSRKVLEVNERVCEILGRTREEMLAAGPVDYVHPADLDKFREVNRELAGVARREAQANLRMLRADGAERWTRMTVALLEEREDGALLATVLLEDIDERRQAELRLRAMFDNVPLGVAICGADGRIREANSHLARMLGCDATEELAGRTLADISDPDDRATAERAIGFHEERAMRFELRCRRADGSPVWARVTVARMSPESNLSTVLVEDLSERRSFEDQLRQAQKLEAVGLLAGGVAHDFNNILAIILGASELLAHLEGLPDEADSMIAQVQSAAERGAQVTHRLLAFSSRQRLNPRVLDLNETVRETERLLSRLLREDIRIETRPAADLMPVLADPAELVQVLMNLAINARDAMPGGGRLVIATANRALDAQDALALDLEPGGYVELTVSDTGEGMAPEVCERIFEPFFTTKAPGSGTGLGLSTIYGIVRQSGGRIDVESSPGSGTTFTVLLPQAPGGVASPEAAPRPAHRTAGATTATILVVEDEVAVRNLEVRMLESLGHRVLVAASGDDALVLSARHDGPIDLLLVDVIMPEIGGPELALRLSALRPSMRVLYVSGYAGDLLSTRGVLDGDVALLEKPFTLAELDASVAQLLEQSPVLAP